MNKLVFPALLVAVATSARADAPLTPAINAITESQLWQDYSGPTFDYLQGLLPGANYLSATQQFLDEWQRLHEDDAQYEPNMDGAPQIPSSCLETGDEACQQCFGPAYEKLNFVRFTLERLRAIYQSTKANTNRSISLGDSLAPSTGIAAIEWNRQKNGILEALEHLKGTYREKYNGLMGTLRTALGEVAACEKQIFHEDNWYDRFGFIYYTYMQDRYLLTD
jgi:hypothetical protein